MIAGYVSTLALLRQAGASELVDVQDSLRLDYVDDRGVSTLACPPVLAPLHLGLGLLTQRLPWRVRWDALRFGLSVRFGPMPEGLTLAELFVRTGQSAQTRRLLWDPLATAILNETPERADAGLFVTTFRAAFLQQAAHSALVFARVGLGEIAGRLGEYFVSRGGLIRTGTRVGGVEVEAGRVRGVEVAVRPETRAELESGVRSHRERHQADAVVLAVPWTAVEGLVPEPWRAGPPFAGLAGLGASPIVSVDVWVDRPVLELPMVGLRDEELEWVFDKGRLLGRAGVPQHLSFVASAACRAQPRANAELVASALGALRRYFPAAREAQVVRSLVRREPEATFVCGPSQNGYARGRRRRSRGCTWPATGRTRACRPPSRGPSAAALPRPALSRTRAGERRGHGRVAGTHPDAARRGRVDPAGPLPRDEGRLGARPGDPHRVRPQGRERGVHRPAQPRRARPHRGERPVRRSRAIRRSRSARSAPTSPRSWASRTTWCCPWRRSRSAIGGELSAHQWPYTYHQRLFAHPDLGRLDSSTRSSWRVERVAQTPYTRRAVATTAVPEPRPVPEGGRAVPARDPAPLPGGRGRATWSSTCRRAGARATCSRPGPTTSSASPSCSSCWRSEIGRRTGRPVRRRAATPTTRCRCTSTARTSSRSAATRARACAASSTPSTKRPTLARSLPSEDATELLVLPQLKGLLEPGATSSSGASRRRRCRLIEELIAGIESGALAV